MTQILLFILSGVLIGLAFSLLFFRMATKRQLEKTKLSAMATMYNETLLKQRDKGYRYSDDAETVIKAVRLSQIVE